MVQSYLPLILQSRVDKRNTNYPSFSELETCIYGEFFSHAFPKENVYYAIVLSIFAN